MDGHPAIAYFDDTNDDLKYVRANDADGLSWGNPVTVFSEGGTGRFPSLAVYEGVPVLVFQGALPFSVEFIKALDATGSSWGSPQTIHNIGQTGEQNQVRVLGNRIGLGWYASQDQSMYYAAGLPCESPVLPELSASQSEVCQGSSVELFASGNGAIHWFSDAAGENFLATGESFTVSELESSNSFFASSNSCGEFSALSEITIDVIPSTTINQQFSVCEGEFVTVGDNEYFNTGNFQDVFTSVLGCDSIVNTQLTVNDFPEASVSLNDLTISASPDNANYQWITCDGELIEGETSQTFQVSAPGSYAVIVDFEGCADTSSCLEVSLTGVEENINYNLSIYPNPASDAFKFSDSKEHHWEIYTVAGQLIKTGFSSTVATRDLSSGVYILNCQEIEGRAFRLTINK